MKIGILSDTHGFLMPPLFNFFADCEQIWHCGDIGNLETYKRLQEFKPLQAVFGNVDGIDIRKYCPPNICFQVEGLRICMTHIGGYPKHYSAQALTLINKYNPDIFVCGHSHILKVMRDTEHRLLFINPGAAGYYGFHKYTSALRFEITGGKPLNLEVYQIPRDEAAKLSNSIQTCNTDY